jgi:hypothetical protein
VTGAPKHISFAGIGTSKSGKTVVWSVLANTDGSAIGSVKWYAPWRGYAFFPRPNTVYEFVCLNDIATFCEAETIRHRRMRAAEAST